MLDTNCTLQMNEKFSREKNPNQLHYISILWEIYSLTRNQTNLFVCMGFFLVPLKNFHSERDVIIANDGLQFWPILSTQGY